MLISLFLVAAGYMLIFGAGALAERALKTAAGLAIILSVLPGLARAISARVSGIRPNLALGSVELEILLGVLLAGVGLFAWRARGLIARRQLKRREKWGTPRERAIPPPPTEAADRDQEAP